MTVLYLDSNALAKLYLDENSGEQGQVIDLLDDHEQVFSSAIAYAEIGGILARLFHSGHLSEQQYGEKLDRFDADWETVNVLDVVPEISRRAVQVMKAQPGLRAMDALHLASALALRQSVAIKFLSFDARLQTAAQKLMPEAVV